ncbi:hypothetical protein X798_03038 [Onchocerca flexuosa]|uniref:Uncharacterized protein n=1 Tax=Onchocerca flexuosa TaxID=387005 RepID=A0A238BXC0_9BILA|nr:hypothetical protein X798_03038 [Onchocerca flexuosa]
MSEMQNYTLLENWTADLREYNNRLRSHLNGRLQLLSKSVMKDYNGADSVYHNNRVCSSNQETMTTQPSIFQILNHKTRNHSDDFDQLFLYKLMIYSIDDIFSVGYMNGTSNISAHLEAKTETVYCEKAYFFCGSKSSDYHTANRKSTKAICSHHRLWRPF